MTTTTEMSDEERYPEHAKLTALRCPGQPDDPYAGHNQLIGEFLDWLQGEGYTICRWRESKREELGPCEDCAWRVAEGLSPDALCMSCSGTGNAYEITSRGFYAVHKPIPTLLAEYYGIDEKKLDDEKRHMLAEVRAALPGRREELLETPLDKP